jgi:GT2 family glycosyltransferase
LLDNLTRCNDVAMRVSVVVPTYRRPRVLSRCLSAQERQDRAPDEVIVVVRREDEASHRVARAHAPLARIVTIDVPTGSPGVVMALNAGVAAASGEVICLTDDDAEARLDWIARIERAFALDPRVGAVGGRDWVFHGERLEEGAESRVGLVSWFGRTTGNHHLGSGPARDVDVLKGVNLSIRGDLAGEIGFDRRLRAVTTEHHWELGLCLALRRRGCRVVYDPAIAVDHRPQPRVAEDRERGERDLADAVHNETLAMLEHLSPAGRVAHLVWALGVGSRASPGFTAAVVTAVTGEGARWDLLRGNMSGRLRALGTYWRSRRGRGVAPGCRSVRVLSVCQSAAAAERASQLRDGAAETEVIAAAPGLRGALAVVRSVLATDVDVLYLVDVGKATTAAAVVGRLRRRRIVVDTGDAGYALARSLGARGFVGLALVGAGEQLALRCADEIVVRGRLHAALMPRPTTHIPDLAPVQAKPVEAADLGAELELAGVFVVGLVGSLNASPRHGISYGWDLIEALPMTDRSVVALIVGDGSGLEPLRRRAEALGVAARCRFVGRVPPERVNAYVSLMNAAISTQTNDIVGRVRTTGKLPLYLSCGCPVIATHVGEAEALLGPYGWTQSYTGVVDRSYPGRLAAAIEAWRLDPAGERERRRLALRIAAEKFDAEEMCGRLETVIERVSR